MVFNRLRKQGLIVVLDGVLIDLPSPVNISMWWNFGSLLGVVLVIQLLSGVFLAMHYTCDIEMAFASVSHIVRDVNGGWFLRSLHANGASFFFLCIYCHIGRGLYYGSYAYIGTWLSGLSLLFLVMAAAFLGYVLPWGQMSYWGATVITNLFSAFPYFGEDLVLWLWGGYSVNNATLTRFFAFHFMVPFIVAGMAGLHIVMLHGTGSNNPLGVCSMTNKIPFHWYFTIKDVAGFIVMVSGLVCLVMFSPNALGEPDNFIIANPLITPPHIVPEWYFLFAYAILRSIPNKLGGVLGLAGSIVILGAMPFLAPTGAKGMRYYPLSKFLFWGFVLSFFMLTVGGAWPVDDPYIGVSQFFSLCYFFFFVSHVPCRLAQDELMLN